MTEFANPTMHRVALRLEAVTVGELASIDLTIAPGEVTCLSGASGSGKTRLLRAVADLEPHGGEVWLGQAAQSSMPAHEWRRQVMQVPAESHWWADSVGEHLLSPPSSDDLEALGFNDQVLEWQVARLSSGEKQRLALLRAVACRPSALLLDEPTANLDEASVRHVEVWLVGLAKQRGWPLLWVAHDRGQIERVADHHRHIRDGELVEAGELAWA